jgi:hypothetical protein
VDAVGLALAVAGTLAGIAGAFFAWVPVRGTIIRRRAGAVPPGAGGGAVAGFDVFVSYAHADAAWVMAFAKRLQAEGLRVAYDQEFFQAGDLLVSRVEAAIRESAHGILVFSAASVASKWVRQEYATMMQRSIESGTRFIPVIIEDAELPEFARTRYGVDFRNVSAAQYDELIAGIVKAARTRP